MVVNPDFVAPCGLYCGVCAIRIAHRDANLKLKERLVSLYKGEAASGENLTLEDIRCGGCLSDDTFMHCRRCPIRDCARNRGYTGCHQCTEFPCTHVENFPFSEGKKVILRSIAHWREVGTQKWIEEEEARHTCPHCGTKFFRGALRCNRCRAELEPG